jgi:hypothetical protein
VPRSDHNDYVSSETVTEPITVSALRNVTREAAHAGGVYLIDMATGEATPILAAMVDLELSSGRDLFLYTQPA